LLDYNLPQRNGIDLLVAIKAMPDHKNLAVIMMSTSKADNLALNSINAGAQDFLVKTEINVFRLQRAILNAQARSNLENQLIQSHKRTKELAEHDNLTGLSNRYFFDKNLNIEIKKHQENKNRLALLLIDLDHFKYVNDNYGHDVGDQLLIEVAKRISDVLCSNTLLARLGGDEFAVIFTNIINIHDVYLNAENIINSLKTPFEIENHTFTTAASLGVAIYPDDTLDAKELLKYADISMYRSKHNGRNQISFFDMQMKADFLENFFIENTLRSAINKKQFYLHYQPVIDSQSKKISGVEALIRYDIDNKKQNPDKFIPVAEKSQLIIEIGRWVISEAIKQLSVWHKMQHSNLTMAINLSSSQLNDEGLVKHIKHCIDKYKINAGYIEFELTETALLVEQKNSDKIIQAISDLGCKISLDDFGTGFSSISHLHTFPINTVKIDKSLMPSASSEYNINRLLTGLIVMIQSLNLNIVAEGVETDEDLNVCLKLGIGKIQGYYFDKPLTTYELEYKYLLPKHSTKS
jgi:diguanylate cyclase (GGDEF)-like protein